MKNKKNNSTIKKDEEIIETDEDTKEEDLDENRSLYPYEMPEEVDIREDHLTIFELNRKLEQKKIKLDLEFQRNLVWKDDQKSRFIESILLNIPLPPFYVNQDKLGNYIIVDGLQRSSTITSFLKKNGFKLQNLQVLKRLNNLGFDDLNPTLKTKIEDKNLLLYILKPSLPIKMVYDIFNRINTGGTQLTRQEVRNCIFIGKATRLLKELSEENYFIKAIDYGISPKRMKDKEAILRYLAFKIFDYKNDYKNDMDDFLGNAMKTINKMDDEKIDELRHDFKRVMNLTYEYFRNKNFRLPTDYSRGRINIALLETISYFFSIKSDKFLEKNKNNILSNYKELLTNWDFIDCIRYSTGDKKRVFNRFELVQKILGNVSC